ncbi:MAG: hypothetical protein ACOC44_18440 [Promethearchaeia archaeon]
MFGKLFGKNKWPTDVTIYTKRGKGLVKKKDRASFFKKTKNGERIYKLKKHKKNTKPIPYDYIITNSKGEPHVLLYEFERNEFAPLDIANVKVEGENGLEKVESTKMAIDEDVRIWGVNQDRLAERMHNKKGFFEKYQSMLLMLIFFVGIIVLTYLFMNSISENTTNIVDALKGFQGSVPG